jgi:hypothetical protein
VRSQEREDESDESRIYQAPDNPQWQLQPLNWAERLAWTVMLIFGVLMGYLVCRGVYLAAVKLVHWL